MDEGPLRCQWLVESLPVLRTLCELESARLGLLRQERDDVLQTVCLRLLERADEAGGPTREILSVPWQRMVVRNVAREHVRASKRLRQPSPRHVQPPRARSGSAPREFPTLAEVVEQYGHVLTPVQRVVLGALAAHGSFKAGARALGMDRTTFRRTAARGSRRLENKIRAAGRKQLGSSRTSRGILGPTPS